MSNISVTRFSLDVQSTKSQTTINVGQNDTARTWKISLTDGGKPISLEGLTPCILISCPDGTKYEDIISTVENESEIIYKLSEHIYTASREGMHLCQITLTAPDGTDVCSAEFTMLVTARTVAASVAATGDEKTIIQQAVANERARINDENTRKENENAREAAEEERKSAEKERDEQIKIFGAKINQNKADLESDLESAKTELEEKIENAANSAAKYLDDIHRRALPPMLYIAHRGGALWNVTSADGSTRYFPANTLVGLSTAIRHGFTTLEVDVGRTKDGMFVVYEQDTVDGTAVGNLTLSSIRSKVKITSVVGDDGTTIKATEQVPTLDQVLALCSGLDVDIVLNVKSSTHGKASEIVKLLDDYGLKNHAYISSHNRAELEAYKSIDNSMPLVMLYYDGYTPSESELDDVYKHLKTPINIVFVGMSDDSDIQTACEYVKESNLDGIIAYTIDTQSKLDELSPYIIGCLTNTSFAQEPSHIGNGSTGCYARPSNSTAMGVRCYANSGQGSVASGSDSESGCAASHALGLGALTKKRNGQFACGSWNQADENALFVTGCGTGANGRKNAFTVYDDAIKVGNTQITESQLQNLLALLDRP